MGGANARFAPPMWTPMSIDTGLHPAILLAECQMI